MLLIANISLMFTELPLPDRFAAAARAGFAGVEIQFPYEHEAEELRRAAGDVPVFLINAPASDGRGGVGRSTDSAQQPAFAAGLEEARHYAEMLGARKVNILPGPPPPGQADEVTERTLAANLQLATERLGSAGLQVVVEAINPFDVPGFWLDGLEKALRFLDRHGGGRAKLQFDFYHLARTEPDLVAAILRAGDLIGHVQFADTEGRHEPGTGGIDFDAAFAALRRTGYDDVVAAEYRPAGRTEDGLAWMRKVPAWFGGDARART